MRFLTSKVAAQIAGLALLVGYWFYKDPETAPFFTLILIGPSVVLVPVFVYLLMRFGPHTRDQKEGG